MSAITQYITQCPPHRMSSRPPKIAGTTDPIAMTHDLAKTPRILHRINNATRQSRARSRNVHYRQPPPPNSSPPNNNGNPRRIASARFITIACPQRVLRAWNFIIIYLMQSVVALRLRINCPSTAFAGGAEFWGLGGLGASVGVVFAVGPSAVGTLEHGRMMTDARTQRSGECVCKQT